MADIYVRSTDGSNADSGATWALAKLDGVGAAAIDVAADRIFFSQVHAESTAGPITWGIAGTPAIPSQLLCGNDGAQPPTALATTGTVTTTGANNIVLNGSFYCYGLTFNCGTGAVAAGIFQGNTAGSDLQTYESCIFALLNTGTTAAITVGRRALSTLQGYKWRNCTVRFSDAGQGIAVSGGILNWNGGAIAGTSPTSLFVASTAGMNALVENVDLSGLGVSSNLVLATASQNFKAIFRSCKLPSGWNGSLLAGTLWGSSRVEMYNCDSTDTNYRLQIQDYAGTITQETVLVKTGGASDGTTPLSWKMVCTANASYPLVPLKSGEIARWNATTGTPVTVTVDVLSDSVTNLTDSEIWLDVQYQGTAGFPLGVDVNDATATVLTAAADQTASTAVWTTTGMANPNRQKLSVTFTPQHAGFIQATANFTKASATVYVDPVLQVS